jgi:protein-tyrosine phosphatase
MPTSPVPHRVLFVCLGNICRSPAAEIIFRHLAHQSGRAENFKIDSAGTLGIHRGAPPDPRMAAALARRGYTIRGRSRPITVEDLNHFTLIVTMDETNLADVLRLDSSGKQRSKIRPLVEFCRSHHAPRVPDPYYGGERGFEHVIELLEDGCQGILEYLQPR